jgi:diguanylate cyclase (GGDEF)-like protein/PAS domain S-box-containing protein
MESSIMGGYIQSRILRYLGLIAGVVFLYTITGYFGLFLATEEFKYATAIWVPSGIALGSVLVWGPRALPGVFLGSLLINFYISQHTAQIVSLWESLSIGTFVAAAASLQTLAGYFLITKFVGRHNPLNAPNDILLFALFSGPASCLVNTTLSNLFFLSVNLLPLKNFTISWATWYVGDTIGSLVFTPTFLILFSKPYQFWHARIVPVLIPLCISFVIVGVVYAIAINNVISANQLWLVLTTILLFCVLINITTFLISGQKNLVQSKMNEILSSAGEGIYVVDKHGLFTYINPALEKMWRYKRVELIGKSIHDKYFYSHVCSYRDNGQCPILDVMRKQNLVYTEEETFIRKDDSYFWMEYTCSPLVIDNNITGAVVIVKDIDVNRKAAFELEKLAHYDSLTNLPNRATFFNKLTETIQNFTTNTGKHLLAVCFLDLDNFKQINDNLGHLIGDETLKKISAILITQLEEAYIARLGGDEFALILENLRSTEEINELMHTLIANISKPIKIEQFEIYISVSIGIAIFPHGGKTSTDLIKNADIAMYHAKASGKRTFAFFDEAMTKTIKRLHQIEVRIRKALIKNELNIYYQFQIDNQTKKIVGVEALLRWHNVSLGGQVSPEEFIPIIEKNGLIHDIGEWILQKSFYDYMRIGKLFSHEIKLSINVSVVQFKNHKFSEMLKKVINETRVSPALIYLEITESALMQNPKQTIKTMHVLKKIGINFALDDFGIDYSSMQYLKNLPISQLKIDASFVRDIVADENDTAIIKAIIQLARDLHISTVAEGVETKEQFLLLRKLNCNYSQGFYFYKAMSCEKILQMSKDKVLD